MSFPAGSTSLCTSQTFPAPVVPSTQIASIASSLVTNFSGSAPSSHTFNHPNITFSNLSFCNITVKYSHPEHDDLITVMAWLPIDTWNGRFQAVGGGGASAGLNDNSLYGMKAAIGEGYATITTNAGQINNTHDFSGWGVDKNGRPNVDVLRDLAFVSLRDEALIGKRLIKSFYGQEPMFSYWSGCSQGGRQGLMLAQRYPTLYDGIVASSPAINWAQYYPGMVWPQVVMNALGMYPDGCELDYLTEEVISACDGLDGVKDGIISAMDRCSFDPFAYVGQGFNCSTMGITKKLSKVAAIVANETWTGPRDRDGNFLWYGLNYGADLSGDLSHGEAYAETSCSDNGTCIGQPLDRGTQWLQIFVEDNSPSFDFNAITIVEFARLFGLSVKKYDELIGTANPDLSEFKSAGGKMLGYHGLVRCRCLTANRL